MRNWSFGSGLRGRGGRRGPAAAIGGAEVLGKKVESALSETDVVRCVFSTVQIVFYRAIREI
jgi:hypothetical protein